MTNISIIVVSYNTKDMTIACLQSVFKETKNISFEVIVVDNNSSDKSAGAIADQFPEVKLFACKENLGFARANNLAAHCAKGDYLLLLNPDTVVLESAIDQLYSFALRHPEHRIYGGRTLYADYSLNRSSCWRKPTLWSLFCYATGLVSIFRGHNLFDPESYGTWRRDSIRTVDIVSGCFLMIERQLWDRLNGFDSRFFMYGEDADLCLRAIAEGASPVINPKATIIHVGGASERIRADKMVRLLRAKVQLFQRHWHPGLRKIGLLCLKSAVFSRMVTCTCLDSALYMKWTDKRNSWTTIWKRRNEWGSIM